MGRPAIARHRVLLVDDEPLLRRMFRRWLSPLRWEVIEAGAADEALDRLAAADGAFELMITDNRMPGMSGVELCGHVARRWPGLPMIMVTAFVDDAQGVPAIVLEKPLRAADLLGAVQAVIAAGTAPHLRGA